MKVYADFPFPFPDFPTLNLFLLQSSVYLVVYYCCDDKISVSH